MPVEPDLAELATAHGIAVRYRDSSEREVELDRDVVIDVLQALEVDASTPSALASALDAVRGADPDALPATVVVDEGHDRALPAAGVVTLEDGARARGRHDAADRPARRLPPAGVPGAGGHADRGAAPADAAAPDVGVDGAAVRAALAGLVGLRRLRRPRRAARAHGRRAGRRRAAGEPAARARAWTRASRPSPYSPSSRRFLHPLYLRVADTAAYAAAPASVRDEVDALRPADGELVDHDAVWAAKSAALALLHPYDPAAPADVEALEEDQRDVATWYALAERHGSDLRSWPAGLRARRGLGGARRPGRARRPRALPRLVPRPRRRPARRGAPRGRGHGGRADRRPRRRLLVRAAPTPGRWPTRSRPG